MCELTERLGGVSVPKGWGSLSSWECVRSCSVHQLDVEVSRCVF